MALVTGQLRSATGQPLTTPFSISLTDYGVKAGLLYLPAKVTVTPDLEGEFAVELWANQESDTPVLYRVDTPQGSSFFISIPSGVLGTFDIGQVVVTKSDLKHDTNILNRLAQLEARPIGGGNGSGVVQVLTFGDGLTDGTFDGSAPATVSVSTMIARVNSPTFVNPRSNQPPARDLSDLLATTGWAGNAANLTTGVIPSERLPSNLVATTAQRLATSRSIFGVPFDGSADLPALSLGAGLLAPSSTAINIDFSLIPTVGDARFTNSREWVAPTVTLPEAQGGVDTNRRAWTVQRVWQAIAAWWDTVQGSLARLSSPAFTGTPTAPSPPANDVSTKLATTSWSSNAANLTQGTIPVGRIPVLNQDTTGTAAAANKLSAARNILGFPFDGSTDLPLTLGNGLSVSTNVLGLDPTEPRLSDAREWVASTVTQVEAEAGTSTARGAWTPLRVRQAITAWWASFENTIARLNSPAFTGTPTAPSPSGGDASTKLATTEWAGNASNLTLGTIPLGRIPTLNQSTTGNAATATRLATPRTIMGVAFDGTVNIAPALTTGLIYPSVGSLGVDFSVVAPLSNPSFTGAPLVPTPNTGDSSTKIANTAFCSNATNLISGTINDSRLSTNIPRLNTTQINLAGSQVQGTIVNLSALVANTQSARFTSGSTGNSYEALINANAPTGAKVIDWELNVNGNLSLRRINDTYSGVLNTPLVVTPSGSFLLSGFTSLGFSDTAVKCRVYRGTTPSTQGQLISVAHGLTGDKILSWTCKIAYSPNLGVSSEFDTAASGFAFDCSHDASNFTIFLSPASSSQILSKPFIILAWVGE